MTLICIALNNINYKIQLFDLYKNIILDLKIFIKKSVHSIFRLYPYPTCHLLSYSY